MTRYGRAVAVYTILSSQNFILLLEIQLIRATVYMQWVNQHFVASKPKAKSQFIGSKNDHAMADIREYIKMSRKERVYMSIKMSIYI